MVTRLTAWYPDELAHAGAEHLVAAYVATYDRKAGVEPAAEVALLQRFGLDGNSTLVDLGAGTRTIALAAVAICRRVVAVDVSPAMVSAIRRRAAELGLPNVECVQSGFLSYQHAGEAADFVYSRHALPQLLRISNAHRLRVWAGPLALTAWPEPHDVVRRNGGLRFAQQFQRD